MQAAVLYCEGGAWEVAPRSVPELEEAATQWERAAEITGSPNSKADFK